MTDIQLLFAVLAGLYLWECACWLRRDALALATWWGRKWTLRHPGSLVGNQRGGFVLAPPLPPLGSLLVAHQFPFTLATEGVLFFVATNINPGLRTPPNGRFLKFSELEEVRARGKKLLVKGVPPMALASSGMAKHWADQLNRLRGLRAEERTGAIAALVLAALDAKAIKQRWEEATTLVKPIRVLTNALFVFAFGIAPLVIWRLGLALSWLGLVAGLLALTVTTAFYFRRAHRVLFPMLEDDRFTYTLTIALAPTSAMRAHDTLLRHGCEQFHPVALARVFLGPEEFQKFARRVVLDLRHPAQPVCPEGHPEMIGPEAEGRGLMRAGIEEFLRKEGFKLEVLCRPPVPADAGCRAYCPRCEAQFTTLTGECADCGGVGIVPFTVKA